MVDIANEQIAAGVWALNLGMTAEAQVGVANREELWIDGPMRSMTGGAPFPQRRVLKNERPGLLAMASGAGFVEPRHSQSSGSFKDISAVRIVTLNAIHFAFGHRVVFGQMKLRIYLQMAFVAGLWILARIDDHLFASRATRGDMLAARSVASLAAVLAAHAVFLDVQTGVGAGRKNPCNIGVAVCANFVAHKCCSLNPGRLNKCMAGGRAGFEQNGHSGQAEANRRNHNPPRKLSLQSQHADPFFIVRTRLNQVENSTGNARQLLERGVSALPYTNR